MPSPPISPTSLSPSSKMASLASILHQSTSTGPAVGSSNHPPNSSSTQPTSSKSTPAPPTFQHNQTSPPPPPPPPPPPRLHPLSPTTVQRAAHTAVQDLPFYHQLEQVQRVREGKFPGASVGGGADAALRWAEAAAAVGGEEASSGEARGSPSTAGGAGAGAGDAPGVFERQIEEVESAKEALRKAGGGFVVGGPVQWQQGQLGEAQLKVQVQGDGRAKVRMMGQAEEADRDEAVARG